MARTLLRRGETIKPDATRELSRRVRERLSLAEDATVSIVEIACGEAACGGSETAILVMRPGHATESVTLKKPVASVTDDDLLTAFASYSSFH